MKKRILKILGDSLLYLYLFLTALCGIYLAFSIKNYLFAGFLFFFLGVAVWVQYRQYVSGRTNEKRKTPQKAR